MNAVSAKLEHQRLPRSRGPHGVPVRLLALLCVAALALTAIDALANLRDSLDPRLLRAIQRIDVPGSEPLFRVVDTLTGLDGVIPLWGALLIAFVLLRWWLPALTLMALPAANLINQSLNLAIGRDRPSVDEFGRVIGDGNAFAQPSGHVVTAVLMYGALFIIADHIASTLMRRTVKAACIAIILAAGLAQVWYGLRWPSDVTAGYALGGLILMSIVVVYRRIDAVTGTLPFVHAAIPPHDEDVPHAHALTSLVLFEGPAVEKIYGPGFLPRIIYWLAFQAEFPYIRNQFALRAALHRRNLAAMLSEYWYGEQRVARVTGIEPVGDRFAVCSEFVDGHKPHDRAAARAFLADLVRRFEEVGYPTWQIDPRQPRAVDNVLETEDGRYVIVDLESGLVSPLASLRAWGRAFRRSLVPIFDDIYYDLTRAYVAREEAAMRAARGDAWMNRLLATLERAEAETNAWRASEPRIWSHFVSNLQHGFGVRHWPAHLTAELADQQERVRAGLEQAIAAHERAGRLAPAEAAQLRGDVASLQFQAVLPHLGAHLALSLLLRFPFGSIARFGWTATALGLAALRRRLGQTDDASWQRARRLHSPLVLLLSLVPTIGVLAYLLSAPARPSRLLARVAADAALAGTPFQLYRRSGLQRLIALPPRPATAEGESIEPPYEGESALSAGHGSHVTAGRS